MTTSVQLGSQPRGIVPDRFHLNRLSIELTNQCSKGCWFCYNHSGPGGATSWDNKALIELINDCAVHGINAVSFGGGEPLEYDGLFDLLSDLDGLLIRSLTTNGLHLDDQPDLLRSLSAARPDKVHVSIHFPERQAEIDRAIRLVQALETTDIPAGVNLLVRASDVDASKQAWKLLSEAKIGPERIVLLPSKGSDTPGAKELADVAGQANSQSMSCLLGCAASPRYASIGWDRRIAWCSYTQSRRHLTTPTYAGVVEALTGLELITC